MERLRGRFRSILPVFHPELPDPPEPILVLGMWCDLVHLDLRGLEYGVLPDPWADGESVARAEAYCWDVCRRLTPRLAEWLNAIHGTQHGLRYWEVLLGFWLLHIAHVLYDRYVIALRAHETAPEAAVTVPRVADPPPPQTASAWLAESWTDDWNIFCFQELFRRAGHRVQEIDVRAWPQKGEGQSWTRRWEQALGAIRRAPRYLLTHLAATTSEGDEVLLAVWYHLTPPDWAWFRGAIPGIGVARARPRQWRSNQAADPTLRAALAGLPAADEFEEFLVRLLPVLTPVCFLEGYRELCRRSHRRFGGRVKSCLVDGNVMFEPDLLLLEFIARCAGEGKPVWTVQNGGGYGYFRTRPEERLAVELADRFLSWGWGDAQAPRRVDPLPSPHLSRLQDSYRGGEKIVLTDCEFPRYVYRLMSCPVDGRFVRHRAMVAQYVTALPESLRRRVIYKPYPVKYGWKLPQVLAGLPDRWPGRPPRAAEWNQDARLAVVAYPDTAFIEALAINVPTIGMWDPGLWEMHERACGVFGALTAAGIVHHDPEQAAAATTALYEDPGRWWQSPSVQQARLEFLDGFGKMAPDWREAWRQVLDELRTATPAARPQATPANSRSAAQHEDGAGS